MNRYICVQEMCSQTRVDESVCSVYVCLCGGVGVYVCSNTCEYVRVKEKRVQRIGWMGEGVT